jgi:tetratricopeptide (TPR) repeat protein
MVQGLHECGPAETLSLSGLSEVEVGEVLQRTLVAPSSDLTPVVQAWSAEWLSQVHAWCRGNPLFLVAAMTEGLVLGGELPSMLRSSKQGMNTSMSAVQIAIRGRLDRLSMPALRLVEVAATMGRAADFELMQAVAVDLSRGEDASVSWLDALEELLRQQWLLDDEESDGYDFQHDRVREAVLAEMTWPRRQALHISIACQLGTREQPEHALMAEHEECAHRWSAAAELWLRAGMQAEALFAVQKAIAHYTKGLRLVEEHAIKTPSTLANDLLERRGLAHVWLSRAEEAAVDLRPAVHRAVSQHRTGRAVELLIELGMCYQRADHYALGAATLHQALDLARELNDANAIATAMWWLADIEWTLDNNRASHHWFRQVMSLCESATVRDDILIKAHHGLGEVAAFDSRPAEAQAHFARSLALACRTGDVRMRCENLTIIAWAHLGACGTGQYDVALDHCEQVVALVEQTGMTWYLGPTWVCQGAALAALGRFGAAIDCFQQALGVAQDLGMPRFEAMARTWLAECCLDSERPDLALEHARLARAIMDRTGVRFFSHHLHAVYAHALVRLGRLDDVPDLPQLLADARERWLGHAVLRALDCLTELRFREGDVVAAKRTAREWAAVARAHGVIEMRLRAVAWVSRLHAATSAGHRNLRRTEHLLRLATPLGCFSLTLSLRREVVRCWQGGADDFAHRDAVKALEASLAAAHPLLEAVSLA